MNGVQKPTKRSKGLKSLGSRTPSSHHNNILLNLNLLNNINLIKPFNLYLTSII